MLVKLTPELKKGKRGLLRADEWSAAGEQGEQGGVHMKNEIQRCQILKI
jgi:hypothetical protein